MKTTNLLTALLVLTIQVMVNGQTSGSQNSYRILPVLGSKAANTNTSDISPNNKEKVYPTLLSTEIPANTESTSGETNNINTRSYANQLIKQAEELTIRENTLRKEAQTKKDEEKKKLIASASALFMQATIKQILASEINGKLNLEQYNVNFVTFNTLIVKLDESTTVYVLASELKQEAAFSIKQAKEMREEAYSLKSLSARLGVLSNAEEKEVVALEKQQQAIEIVKKSLAANTFILSCDLAVR